MREPAHDNIALAPHITEPQHSNRIAYRIRYPRLEVSIGYITTDIRCTTPSPLCQCPCGPKTAHKLWSINALPAEETSSQTHESTAAVCPASSCRESPGSCLFLCVGIGWVWLSLINHPWFTAESEAGASIGLQNEAVITTPPGKKTFSHLHFRMARQLFESLHRQCCHKNKCVGRNRSYCDWKSTDSLQVYLST